jgi:hypothetical protein
MASTDRAFRALARDAPATVVALVRLVAPDTLGAADDSEIVALDDPNLDEPPHPREADFAALVGRDALSHVELQGYGERGFDLRVFDYHLGFVLRHPTRTVRTLAIWLSPPRPEQRAAVLRRGALQLERAVVVLSEVPASLLLSRAETACFAPAGELGALSVDELCDRVVAALARPGASEREKTMAAVAAHTRGRYPSLMAAMERAKMEPVIIQDLVDIGYDQGLAEGIERGIEQGIEQGIARGRAEESARAVVAVLQARGLLVSEAFSARLRGCTDLATLERWLQRAVTVARAEDVFEEG